MSHVLIDATSIPAGHGPHPAASPFARRISEALHVTALQVYAVIAFCAEQRGVDPSAGSDAPGQPSRSVHRELSEEGAR